MSTPLALINGVVETPEGPRTDLTICVRDGRIAEVEDPGIHHQIVDLEGDHLVAGGIDVQVNGGGGQLFNDDPSLETLTEIAAAHCRLGTTSILPTLITDSRAQIAQAIAAVDQAIRAGHPGIAGIHLEGPFLNPAKKGIHDGARMDVLDADAIDLLTSLRVGRTLITVSPETAPPGMIAQLVARGALVFAGHSDARFDDMERARAEGLSGVTHLFNAMRQLTSREPGVVGAGLAGVGLYAGIIADGQHVHPANLALAARCVEAGKLMLVSDAMPCVGTDSTCFQLQGQTIFVRGDSCFAADGTLAGANLSLMRAVQLMRRLTGLSLGAALALATANPAQLLGLQRDRGAILPGLRADLVRLSRDGDVRQVWQNGVAQRDC